MLSSKRLPLVVVMVALAGCQTTKSQIPGDYVMPGYVMVEPPRNNLSVWMPVDEKTSQPAALNIGHCFKPAIVGPASDEKFVLNETRTLGAGAAFKAGIKNVVDVDVGANFTGTAVRKIENGSIETGVSAQIADDADCQTLDRNKLQNIWLVKSMVRYGKVHYELKDEKGAHLNLKSGEILDKYFPNKATLEGKVGADGNLTVDTNNAVYQVMRVNAFDSIVAQTVTCKTYRVCTTAFTWEPYNFWIQDGGLDNRGGRVITVSVWPSTPNKEGAFDIRMLNNETSKMWFDDDQERPTEARVIARFDSGAQAIESATLTFAIERPKPKK